MMSKLLSPQWRTPAGELPVDGRRGLGTLFERLVKGRAMSESTNTAARERLEALIGEWTVEATPPGGPPWPGGGRVTFEWLEGIPLLIERWHVDMPEAPDGVAVIGCDGMSGTYYQLYTDERDVQRVYEMSLDAGVWKLWRDGAPFSQ